MRHNQYNIWNTLAKNKTTIIIVFLLSLMARAQTIFNPLYAIDTYSMTSKSVTAINELFLSQGRFGLILVYRLRELLGYQGFDVSVSANVFATLMMTISGVLLASTLSERSHGWPITAFSLLFVLHPFGTEFFHFSEATFTITLSFLVASIGIYLAVKETHTRSVDIAAIVVMAFAISIYQTTAAMLMAACLMALTLKIIGLDRFSWSVFLRLREVRALVLALLSLVTYGTGVYVSLAVTGVKASSRADISSLFTLEGLWVKIQVTSKALWISLWTGFDILGPSAQWLLLVLLVASASFILLRLKDHGILAFILAATLISGAFIASVLPPTLSSDHWLVPRTLWTIVIPTAAVVCLGWTCAPRLGRWSITLLMSVLCLIYIGVSNRMIMDQRRMNHQDAQKANRILSRLETLEGFGMMKSVAIIGGYWGNTSTTVGDMNISALYAGWSKIGLLREVTGYSFNEPTSRELETAQSYCANAFGWPHRDSVVIKGSLGVVCLSGK